MRFRVSLGEQTAWTLFSLTTYVVVAVVLVLVQHQIVGDALSRVGNAYYVMFSRDPHLGAIGFVWNPLPSILVMPLLPLGRLWPALVTDGFAGCIVSTLAMAFAVRHMVGLLREWRLGVVARTALTAMFAFHPLIIQYGANGDSEALFLLFLIVAVRYTAQWLDTRTTGSLVRIGGALALAYLTRYEAGAAAFAIGCLIGVVSYRSARGEWRERLTHASAEAAVLLTPFVFVFLGWAAASWLIVGSPFEQFSSAYGNSAQLELMAVSQTSSPERAAIVGGQILGLQPLIVGIAFAAAVIAFHRRSPTIAAVTGIFGSVLTLAIGAWLLGKTGGWLRYYIAVVPLAVLLVATLLRPREAPGRIEPMPLGRFRLASVGRALAGFAIVLVALGPALSSTMSVMTHPVFGREDHYKGLEASRYEVARTVAGYVDRMALRDGAVLIDVFLGSSIVLNSSNPRQFVITADRDFQAVVSDPVAFDVQYVLIPPGGGLGGLDAIERRWPGMYESGAGLGRLAAEFSLGDSPFRWRLWDIRVEDASTRPVLAPPLVPGEHG